MTSTAEQPAATDTDYDGGFDEITEALANPKFRDNPYALYAQMRHEHPVYRSSRGVWYLTRYADVEVALHDLRLSSDRDRVAGAMIARQGSMARWGRMLQLFERQMVNADPPDHTRLRKPANKAFIPRRIQGLRSRVQTVVDDLLDAAVAAGAGQTIDIIAALARPLPIIVISELFGVPRSDRKLIRRWSQEFVNGTDPQLTAQGLDQVEHVLGGEFECYLRDLIRVRRAEPADDILSVLIAAQERGDLHSEDELVSTCSGLLIGGQETIVNLIGNGMLALLRHPDQLRRLQEDPTLIRSAVEELLRYDSPGPWTLRAVAVPVEIGGQALGEGELVLSVLGAANRDPDRFADPDRLDLGRADNRHLAFGAGPHFCLGAPLARLEGEIAIGTLVRRFPALRLDTDTPDWRSHALMRGLESLSVSTDTDKVTGPSSRNLSDRS